MLLHGGVFDVKGLVLTRQKNLEFGDSDGLLETTVVHCESVWTMRQTSNAGANIHFKETPSVDCRWYTNTTGGDHPFLVDIHGFQTSGVGSVTIRDSASAYGTDDVLFLRKPGAFLIERVIMGPSGDPGVSGNLIDLNGGEGSSGVVRNVLCRTCISRDQEFPYFINEANSVQGALRTEDVVLLGGEGSPVGGSAGQVSGRFFEHERMTIISVPGSPLDSKDDFWAPNYCDDCYIRDCLRRSGGAFADQVQRFRRVLVEECDSGDAPYDRFFVAANRSVHPVLYEDVLFLNNKMTGETAGRIIADSEGSGSEAAVFRRVAVVNTSGFDPDGVAHLFRNQSVGLVEMDGVGMIGLAGDEAVHAYDGLNASTMNNPLRTLWPGPICFHDNVDAGGSEAHLPASQVSGLPPGMTYMSAAPPLGSVDPPQAIPGGGTSSWVDLGCFPFAVGVPERSWALRAADLQPGFLDFVSQAVCNDGLDNDGDGLADFPDDPGCANTNDDSERENGLACDDGSDDDMDGLADFPDDPGCEDPLDGSENRADLACDDGFDDDGDGLVDLADPGCGQPDVLTALMIGAEAPPCQDGLDNDGDGGIDFDGGLSIFGTAVAEADPDCMGRPWQSYEAPSRGCGLGPELAPLLLGLLRLRPRGRGARPRDCAPLPVDATRERFPDGRFGSR